MSESGESVELIERDGIVACSDEDCGWWAPNGMDYLFDQHKKEHRLKALPDEWRDKIFPDTSKEIQSRNRTLDQCAEELEERLDEVFGDE